MQVSFTGIRIESQTSGGNLYSFNRSFNSNKINLSVSKCSILRWRGVGVRRIVCVIW